MPWTTLPFGDARIQQFLKHYEVTGVPKLIIIDSRTGFKITDTARKDLQLAQQVDIGVQGVWKSWLKLHEINKVKGVKRAQEDAIAATQQGLRDEQERRKREIERIQGIGGEVKAEIA